LSDLLTTSRLSCYRRCQRREQIEYVQGFRPVETSEALAFGILWHVGLEQWWLAHQRGEPTAALEAALGVVAGRARDEYEQAKIDALFVGYDAQWGDQQLEVVAVEQEFRTALVNPETMQPSRTWRLGGKIDALAITADGRKVVIEHKTAGTDIAAGSIYWIKLQLDPQLSVYTIGAESMGFTAEATVYDVVLKPALRPQMATPPESRKFTTKGALYAGQRADDETPAQYGNRIRLAIEADPGKFYARREIPRTESQLSEFLADAWALGRSMRESHLADRAPRNPDSCHLYGSVCPWWMACSTGERIEEHPERYRRLEFQHPELTPEETA